MKKLTVILLISLFLSTSMSASASGWDISDLLGKVSSATASDSTKTGSSGSSKAGGLGDLLSGVANALGVGSSKLTVEKMVGTWNYVNPAVSFKSDNFLLKAGGAAAAQQVEAKLAPYYKTAGLTSLVMTINADSTFTFKARMMTLSGTITKDAESGNFIFNFKAFKKIKVGSMEGFIVMNGNKMELTFDVTKLMTLVEKAGSLSGNSTIKGLTAILQQYDGMTAGFELQRQN
ncbi:DUF4923 family protein [Duncaniella sp.]|uniref:lipocalin-like domain-containing protein n=1 Tax=Duncaniella sp. TaxID=2518496 RepID=UPI0023C7452F|nr:DUF4923 family protein [Duncaniella sp.]MDE5903829.1 DUF4923 family protein [Duncaniella sp.]